MSLIRVSFWCKLAISAEDSPNTFKECLLVVRGLPFCAAGVGSWRMEVSECWSWDASTTDVGLTEWAVTWCGDAVFSSVVTANAFWDISPISVSTWNIAGPSGSLLVFVSWYNGSFHSGWLGESISVPWRKGPFNVSSWLRKWGTRALSQYVLGISSCKIVGFFFELMNMWVRLCLWDFYRTFGMTNMKVCFCICILVQCKTNVKGFERYTGVVDLNIIHFRMSIWKQIV